MPDTLTPPRPRAPQRNPTAAIVAALAALVLAALLWTVVAPLLSGPGRVSLTIDNQTTYEVTVSIAEGDAPGVGLGTAPEARAQVFDDVIDLGERWTFRFSYGGVEGAAVTTTRAELVAADWTVAVPDAATAAFEAAGLAPAA